MILILWLQSASICDDIPFNTSLFSRRSHTQPHWNFKIKTTYLFLSVHLLKMPTSHWRNLSSRTWLSANVKYCLSNGIMLGKCSYQLPTERELNGTHLWLQNVEIDHKLPNTCRTYVQVQKHNDYNMHIVYWTGGFVIVKKVREQSGWYALQTS